MHGCYMCTHIPYTWTHTHIHINTYINYTQCKYNTMCMCTHTHTHIHAHMHLNSLCTHTHTHIRTHTHTHAHTHTHTHTHNTHTHTQHTHKHSNTLRQARWSIVQPLGLLWNFVAVWKNVNKTLAQCKRYKNKIVVKFQTVSTHIHLLVNHKKLLRGSRNACTKH